MADVTTQDARLTGTVPMYKEVEPLNRQKHATWGVRSLTEKPFEFMRQWHFVPAIAAEFGFASGSYPIVFLGDRKLPVIVMGLRPGANVFVNNEGTLDPDHYMPTYIRRYPFVSAAQPDGQPSTVCIDVASDFVVSENPEIPFFDAEGNPTDYTNQAIDYVSAFEQDAKNTEAFVERLTALDLLEKMDVKVADPNTPDTPVTVAEYWGVSAEKFQNLPDDKIIEMHKNGDLMAVNAHLMSLQRWERILTRTSRMANEAPAA